MNTDTVKRIITLGLRYSDYDTQRKLFALKNNGEIKIVSEIGYVSEDPEIFYNRMTYDEGLALDYDMVIVSDDFLDEARKMLLDKGFDPSSVNLNSISVLTELHLTKIKKKQIEILKEIIEAPDEKVRGHEWLREKLYDYGFFPFFKLAKEPEPGITWSTVGILQVPGEFVNFCVFLMDYRFNEAIEIGVAAGASSYIMAAIMYRNNPDMIYHMVDINDYLISYDEVRRIIPSLQKDIPESSDDHVGKVYDFCFIDADHSYDGMMRDWMNVGAHSAKMTVFHDIYAHEYDDLNGGTVRGWQEIKGKMEKSHRIREFSKYPDKWMGIGVVEF